MKGNGYIGSVRFFKHLIVTVVLLCLAGSFTATAVLALQVHDYRRAVQAPPAPPEAVEPQGMGTPEDAPSPTPALPGYAALFPDLYAPPADRAKVNEEKTVYLTFDDGPSARTGEILEILDHYGVKATFFVIGREGEDERALLRRIVEEGHALGMHSYSHDYRDVYTSVENCLADYDRLNRVIVEATGAPPQLIRFPGGSINGYNGAIYQPLIAEMTRRGYVYFDWNAAVGDTVGVSRVADLTENALKDCATLRRAVVLMHDSEGKEATVEALPAIIEGYRDAGFQFAALTPEVVPVVFSYTE